MSEEKKIGGRAFGAELNVEKFIEEQIEEIREKQAEREDTFAGKKGKKRDEIKPMKKKKTGFSLFGRHKDDDEDDFVEDGGWDEADEDDFY